MIIAQVGILLRMYTIDCCSNDANVQNNCFQAHMQFLEVNKNRQSFHNLNEQLYDQPDSSLTSNLACFEDIFVAENSHSLESQHTQISAACFLYSILALPRNHTNQYSEK